MGDGDYVRDGGNIELCSNARKECLGRGRMGRNDVGVRRIMGQQLLDEWRDNLGQFGAILW